MTSKRDSASGADWVEAGGQAWGRTEDYEHMSRVSPVATAITALEGDRVCEVNDAFLELSGWDGDALAGRSLGDLGWWDDPEVRRRIKERLVEEGSVREIEAVVRTRSGLRREAIVSAQLLGQGNDARVLTFFQDVTEKNRLRRKLEHLTLHDPLTGLPNRALFRRRLAELMDRPEAGGAIGVLLLDLDRFKVVNDALGHASGDELLGSVADRIRSCFGEGDLAARFGGDDFGVVIERPEEKAVRAAADRVARALDASFEVAGIQVRLSTSIGIAVSPPLTARRPEDLIRFADIALQRARERKGTSVEAFDPDQDTLATESLYRENEMWTALARDEFVLLYQPIVSVVDERIIGCEALVRWNHPERGLVTPDEFVPLAEESGLIFRMGTHVLDRACSDAELWTKRAREDFVMSVNLSPRQFHEPDFVENIGTRIAGSGFPSGSLQLEITEGTVMRTMGTVDQLRDLGVRIAIDDFGTGFSSLQYLRELHVDVLKVDASFTRGIGSNSRDEHIVRAIVLFAHGLGMEVVAEGIETPAQHAFLRTVGCDSAQGYLYAAPVPAAHLEDLLAGEGTLSHSEPEY